MSVTLTNLVTEVQARCNALTNYSLIETVIDCAIAAKKVEMAGGSITRTTLDTQIQRFVTASGSGSVIEDLIALAASVEVRAGNGKTQKMATFTSSGSWTRPSGVDTIEILLVGGGGGSGGLYWSAGDPSPNYYIGCSGAGGGGEVFKGNVDVTSISVGSTASIVIGAGGAAGNTSGSHGGVGGTTSFGSIKSVLGGGGGGGFANGSTGVGTVGATTGGRSGYTLVTSGNVTLVAPGLGGGAGGDAEIANVFYNRSDLANVNNIIPQTVVPYVSSVLGHGTDSSIYKYSYPESWSLFKLGSAGKSLYGYGAGGGSSGNGGIAGLNGAGGVGAGGSAINAAANSGGGAGGIATTFGVSINVAGGIGGSGLAIVTWWE